MSPAGAAGWGKDYDQIPRFLDDDIPCFIIFFKGRDEVRGSTARMDVVLSWGDSAADRASVALPVVGQLLLLLYVPEDSSVKNKMSYSASKGALNTLLNARQFASTGVSSGNSKAVEQIFGTTKAEFTHRAYASHTSVENPMSEVEEALQALPKQLDKKDFGKSMGYSLLATVSGKALPPQLSKYAAGNAASTSTSLFRGGQFNIHSKPSEAKQANKPSGMNVNRPPAGQGILPGFGGAAAAKSSPTNSASAAAAASPTSPSSSSASSSNGRAANGASGPTHVRRLSVSTGKCLVATCENKRVKMGYCQPCLTASEARRAAIAGQWTQRERHCNTATPFLHSHPHDQKGRIIAHPSPSTLFRIVPSRPLRRHVSFISPRSEYTDDALFQAIVDLHSNENEMRTDLAWMEAKLWSHLTRAPIVVVLPNCCHHSAVLSYPNHLTLHWFRSRVW
jgi:hypothetical protein